MNSTDALSKVCFIAYDVKTVLGDNAKIGKELARHEITAFSTILLTKMETSRQNSLEAKT